MVKASTWQDASRQVQEHREKSLSEVIPPIPEPPTVLPSNVMSIPVQLLSARENMITSTVPEDLITLLKTGDLTSEEVTSAFLRRAGLAQKLTNCVTELLPERALKRAKELDAYLRERKKPKGSLHGLPISVKEHYAMKGLGHNGAFAAWVDRKAEDDAPVLKALWNAGCVFYVRTTEPQLIMHLETSSNLYGVTVNPFNHDLTPGGSSGGEGALLGLRGSCLGIGGDIGGSIRTPAAHNGVYGLRPTSLRIPILGKAAPQIGSGYILGVTGPMSTSLEGIKLTMRTILDSKPWITDPSLVPLPWRDQQILNIKSKKLRIAILWDDGAVQPHPPVMRALKEVAQKLKAVSNVELSDWKPLTHDLGWELIASLYFMDGGDEAKALLESMNEPVHTLTRFICTESPYVKHRSVAEIQELKSALEKYRLDYNHHWNSTGTTTNAEGELDGTVDVILCPAFPGVAPPLNTSRYWSYASQWNVLDYPAVVFPVTIVDPALDARDNDYVPRNEQDRYNHSLYESPEALEGVPVSLQLVARRYEDEKLLEILDYMKQQIGLPFRT